MSKESHLKPIVRHSDVVSAALSRGLQLTGGDAVTYLLDEAGAAVWRAIDDQRDGAAVVAAALRGLPTLTARRAWSILDELADARLLVGRAAPPTAAGLDRRALIQVAAGAAAAVAMAPAIGRAQAAADDAELMDELLEVPGGDLPEGEPEDALPVEFPEPGEAVDGVDGPEDLEVGPVDAEDAVHVGEAAADDPNLDDPDADPEAADALRMELLSKRREIYVQRRRERDAKARLRQRAALARRRERNVKRAGLRDSYGEQRQKMQAKVSEERVKLQARRREQPRAENREAARKFRARVGEQRQKLQRRRQEEGHKLQSRAREALTKQRAELRAARGEADEKFQRARAEWRHLAEETHKGRQREAREARGKRVTARRQQERMLKAERRLLEREVKLGRRQEETAKRAQEERIKGVQRAQEADSKRL